MSKFRMNLWDLNHVQLVPVVQFREEVQKVQILATHCGLRSAQGDPIMKINFIRSSLRLVDPNKSKHSLGVGSGNW